MAATRTEDGATKRKKVPPLAKIKDPGATQPKRAGRAPRAPTPVQAAAWEIKGAVKGSLTRLSRVTSVSLDALRVAKRTPGSSGARPIAPSRARLLSLVLAAHRRGYLDELLQDAQKIETEWRRRYPDGLAETTEP